jgi:hypothetical protein
LLRPTLTSSNVFLKQWFLIKSKSFKYYFNH